MTAVSLPAPLLFSVEFCEQFGLALLRTAWFNLDVAWAAALLVTGLVTLVI